MLLLSVGGSLDPALNPALAVSLKKANKAGVPKDNIERALARVRSTFITWSSFSRDGRRTQTLEKRTTGRNSSTKS